MIRRERWRPVLDAESVRWKGKGWRKLVFELQEDAVYEVETESQRFQVEVQLLENTDRYIHVCVSVDDGSLPASLTPISTSFILNKE